jgi:DNA polymerase/3'-5' exonuclease PolX
MSQQLPFKQDPITRSEAQARIDELSGLCPDLTFFVGGGLSRGKDITSDIDLLVKMNTPADRERVEKAARSCGWRSFVRRDYKTAFTLRAADKHYVMDLFFADEDNWGNATLFIVGSKYWNNVIRARLKERGYHWDAINYYTTLDENTRVCFSTPQEALAFVDIRWEEPAKRTPGNPVYDLSGKLITVL